MAEILRPDGTPFPKREDDTEEIKPVLLDAHGKPMAPSESGKAEKKTKPDDMKTKHRYIKLGLLASGAALATTVGVYGTHVAHHDKVEGGMDKSLPTASVAPYVPSEHPSPSATASTEASKGAAPQLDAAGKEIAQDLATNQMVTVLDGVALEKGGTVVVDPIVKIDNIQGGWGPGGNELFGFDDKTGQLESVTPTHVYTFGTGPNQMASSLKQVTVNQEGFAQNNLDGTPWHQSTTTGEFTTVASDPPAAVGFEANIKNLDPATQQLIQQQTAAAASAEANPTATS
jgi:hypothetical protein